MGKTKLNVSQFRPHQRLHPTGGTVPCFAVQELRSGTRLRPALADAFPPKAGAKVCPVSYVGYMSGEHLTAFPPSDDEPGQPASSLNFRYLDLLRATLTIMSLPAA